MDEERAAKLKPLPGWSWEPREDAWEANYQLLLNYVRQLNKIPSRSHPTLGKWVTTQRQAYRAWQARLNGEMDKYSSVAYYMDEERATKLDSLPGWSWEHLEDEWEEKYQELDYMCVSTRNYLNKGMLL